MGKSSKLFVGMDVHKESIDLALAEEHGEVRHQGAVGGDMSALGRAVRKLESLGKSLVFVYEAGTVRIRHLSVPAHARTRVLGGCSIAHAAPGL